MPCYHDHHRLAVSEDNTYAREHLISKRNPSTPSLPFVRRNPSILLTQARVPCTRASVLAMPTTFSFCSREEETPSRLAVRPSLNSIELTPSVGSIEVPVRAATVGDACCGRAAVEHGWNPLREAIRDVSRRPQMTRKRWMARKRGWIGPGGRYREGRSRTCCQMRIKPS